MKDFINKRIIIGIACIAVSIFGFILKGSNPVHIITFIVGIINLVIGVSE